MFRHTASSVWQIVFLVMLTQVHVLVPEICFHFRSNPDAELVPGLPYYASSWSPRKSSSPSKTVSRRRTYSNHLPSHRNFTSNNNSDKRPSGKFTRGKLGGLRSQSTSALHSTSSSDSLDTADTSDHPSGSKRSRVASSGSSSGGKTKGSKSAPSVVAGVTERTGEAGVVDTNSASGSSSSVTGKPPPARKTESSKVRKRVRS